VTVPGVNVVCAASFMAAVGDHTRFITSGKMGAYLGLDPKVKQSGEAPARSGRISKRKSATARWALVEAAWTAVLQPGPLHAFYEHHLTFIGRSNGGVRVARRRP
jgi:transposase